MDTFQMKPLIESTLQAIDAFSPQAVQQLLGTGAHESSGWRYRRQLGNGPALSYFQIEPFTHNDCWENYLVYHPQLGQKILQVSGLFAPDASALEFNDVYAICIARVKYMRDSQPIPLDLHGQAQYWKRVYNTYMGKGTVEEYINHYQMFVA